MSKYLKLTKAQKSLLSEAGNVKYFRNCVDQRCFYTRKNGMTSSINARLFESLREMGILEIVVKSDTRFELRLSSLGLKILREIEGESS